MLSGIPKRVAIYVRVSSTGQQEGYSLETQERVCREYADAHGYDTVATYREIHTAEDFYERPQMTVLREAARQGQFDIVLAFNLDRLSRNQAHVYLVVDELERLGISLEFATENFEDSAVGRFIRSGKAFAAEVELEKIKARSSSGKLAHAQHGGLMHSRSPLYGYSWADDKKTRYVVDPEAAPVLQRIYREYLEGKTLRGLARDLTAEGIPAPRSGGSWDFTSIRRILADSQYTGQATAFRTKTWKEKGKLRRKKLPPEEWIVLPDGTIPPLVDVGTFEGVQVRLRENRERSVRSCKNPEDYLLRAGFVHCGYCGRTMVVVKKTADYAVYGCSKARATHASCAGHCIPTANLDAIVWEHVVDVLTDPTVIERELARMMHSDPSASDLSTIDRALTDIAKKQANVARAIALLQEADAEPLVAELTQLGARKRQMEAERKSVLGRREAWEEAQTHLKDIQDWCTTVVGRLGELTYDQRRLALSALGVQVQVFRADHDPRYIITASIPLDDAQSGNKNQTVLRPTSGTYHSRNAILRWTDRDMVAAS